MQRFPNPVSDLDVILRNYKDIYDSLCALGDFGIDDISKSMVAQNNVTSHGATGQEALRRSTRPERGLDGMYNQSKAWAELFRVLGWMQSTTSRLRYTMTLLGVHIATAQNPAPLICECILGIAYPSEVIDTKERQKLRLHGSILQTMMELGGISRDEMMAGPMSISDDTDAELFRSMVKALNECRAKPKMLYDALLSIAKRRGITISPTMENYTRFPMAAIPWADWGKKDKSKVIHITENGRQMALRLKSGHDVRLNDFNGFHDSAKPAFIRLAFYSMLFRAGFDITSVGQQIEKDRDLLKQYGMPYSNDIYFSPFQQLSRTTMEKWTPELLNPLERHEKKNGTATAGVVSKSTTIIRPKPRLLTFRLMKHKESVQECRTGVADQLSKLIKRYPADEVVDRMADYYAKANKDTFYPLVADLFCIIGFKCRISRAGQNYERSDAIILDHKRSIPIEIKSPGEEMEMSVKGVRQALENKTVLLARKSYPTDKATTSLVVGYNLPNARSEVHELIEDIFNTYGVRIGMIDFRSLVRLAMHSIKNSKAIDIPDLQRLQGVLHVKDI